MIKRLIAAYAVFGMLVMPVSALAIPDQVGQVPQRVIVTYDTAVNESSIAALEQAGAKVLKQLELVNGLVVLLPNEDAVSNVAGLKGVKRVEQDAKAYILKPPGACEPWPACKGDTGDDPAQPSQTLEWGVDRIDADLAWSESLGAGIKVAVIDTGIDQDHADLTANIKGGVNFVSKSPARPADPNKWNDDNGHGTHVAGIIAASDNEIGVIGVAPQAELYAVKVLNRSGSGYVSDIIEGINWAMANDMDVINMSLGTSADIAALHEAVDAAYNAGIVIVAAAGNSGDGDISTNNVEYPAKYDSVIAVGATDINDNIAYFSSDGSEVEVSAPGVNINSTWNDGSYNAISGTSMASPHVAATVALMLSAGIQPQNVRTSLAVEDLGSTGKDNFYGLGLIDAENSVK